MRRYGRGKLQSWDWRVTLWISKKKGRIISQGKSSKIFSGWMKVSLARRTISLDVRVMGEDCRTRLSRFQLRKKPLTAETKLVKTSCQLSLNSSPQTSLTWQSKNGKLEDGSVVRRLRER